MIGIIFPIVPCFFAMKLIDCAAHSLAELSGCYGPQGEWHT